MAKRHALKLIRVLAWSAIVSAFLSFIFLIAYVATAVSALNKEDVKEKEYVAILALMILFIVPLGIYEMIDFMIVTTALMTKDFFANKSNWIAVLCISTVSFFLSGYIGFCGMIAIIVIVSKDPNIKAIDPSELDQQKQFTNVITVTATQEASPSNAVGPAGTTNHTEAASSAEIPLQTMDTNGITVTATQEPSPYSTVGPAGTTNYAEAASSAEVPLPPDPIYGY